MKIIFAITLCIIFSITIFGQTNLTESKPKIAVEEITLARDDGNGTAGEETAEFLTTDIPIHCSIVLNSTASVTVKMKIIAVKVVGLKPESKVVSVSYKMGDDENQVDFTASPAKLWATGEYRVDVFVDDKLKESKNFVIINENQKDK